MPSTRVKICGLSTPESVASAAKAGASYVGFVFFKKSPRNLTPEQARDLAIDVPVGLGKVALTVNADDAMLDVLADTVPLDFLQLQGQESCQRVLDIKRRYGLPVIKAVGVADEADLATLSEYEAVADQVLVDAKPPTSAKLPGGNGVAFDWRLIAGRRWSVPWMLAGGLNAENVAEAISLTGARQVDVSSGVETSPGQKSIEKIGDFVKAAQSTSI